MTKAHLQNEGELKICVCFSLHNVIIYYFRYNILELTSITITNCFSHSVEVLTPKKVNPTITLNNVQVSFNYFHIV